MPAYTIHAMSAIPAPASSLPTGGVRAVFDAIIAASPAALDAAALGLVVATEGSTYAKPGALLSFGPAFLRQGWISGGCLEPVLEQAALDAIRTSHARSVVLDTRDDDDLLFGSRVGCRGCLYVVLLPLAQLPGIQEPLRAWSQQVGALDWHYSPEHGVQVICGARQWHWPLPVPIPAFPGFDAIAAWTLSTAPARRLRVYGAGPESPWLLPGLRALGAYTELIERRPRWRAAAALADHWIDATPQAAQPALAASHALIQHHDFELDREALLALADDPAAHWIGLLGPAQRRNQLLHLLPEASVRALQPRLHAPVGLPLGGRGPEAISLSVCAQLQQRWAGT